MRLRVCSFGALLRSIAALQTASTKKCSGGDLSVYGRLRLRWMLSLQFMQNIAASLSCMNKLYCMFLGLASGKMAKRARN
jgi:hypothetical protein